MKTWNRIVHRTVKQTVWAQTIADESPDPDRPPSEFEVVELVSESIVDERWSEDTPWLEVQNLYTTAYKNREGKRS